MSGAIAPGAGMSYGLPSIAPGAGYRPKKPLAQTIAEGYSKVRTKAGEFQTGVITAREKFRKGMENAGLGGLASGDAFDMGGFSMGGDDSGDTFTGGLFGVGGTTTKKRKRK